MSKFIRAVILVSAFAGLLAIAKPASAWDEDGHAIVAHLAIDALPESFPAWLKTPQVRARLAYLSSEPDRWRGQHNVHLDHINGPDHYFDCEDLEQYGLSLFKLPRFRTQFTDIMAAQRALKPDAFPRRDGRRDRDYTKQSPGLLPYAIAELQWKTAASWTQLKTYEAHRAKVTDAMIENARENIIFHMGLLSHFVGDGAQPLHLTRHHHGWVGDNPAGYTTDHAFHSFIDGGAIDLHGINYDDLACRALPARKISTSDYWHDVAVYLGETYEQVVPLYELEKCGNLRKAEGKAFIEQRLLAGGSTLAGVWVAAYEGAKLDDFRVKQLKARPAGYEPGRRAAQDKAARADEHAEPRATADASQ